MIMSGKVIEFNKKLKDIEDYGTIPFDPGFVARVISINQVNGGLLSVTVDFSEFEERNEKILRPTWPNDIGDPILKWSETDFYPTDRKTTILVYKAEKPFKILRDI